MPFETISPEGLIVGVLVILAILALDAIGKSKPKPPTKGGSIKSSSGGSAMRYEIKQDHSDGAYLVIDRQTGKTVYRSYNRQDAADWRKRNS